MSRRGNRRRGVYSRAKGKAAACTISVPRLPWDAWAFSLQWQDLVWKTSDRRDKAGRERDAGQGQEAQPSFLPPSCGICRSDVSVPAPHPNREQCFFFKKQWQIRALQNVLAAQRTPPPCAILPRPRAPSCGFLDWLPPVMYGWYRAGC